MSVSLGALIQWNDAHVQHEENEIILYKFAQSSSAAAPGIDWMGFEALLNIEFIDEENLLHFWCDECHRLYL